MTLPPGHMPPLPEERAKTLAKQTGPGLLKGGSLNTRPVRQAATNRSGGSRPSSTTTYSGADGNAIAWTTQLAGDIYPRVVCFVDSEGGIYFGDGTFDPVSDGVNLYYDDRYGPGLSVAFGKFFLTGNNFILHDEHSVPYYITVDSASGNVVATAV